jgi:hypothetical protein
MRKRTTVKDRTVKPSRGKKTTAVAKRKAGRKPKQAKTVFRKIRDALDETAAKLKTLLPGEHRSNHREEGIEMS